MSNVSCFCPLLSSLLYLLVSCAGVGDAHSFRLMSYAAAGVKIPAHGSQPPRKITVLGRFSRGFADMPMILRVLQSTGLPVRVVENLRFLTWAEQVALMADTGILLAAHGGALANVIYMPAHAVVIEAFPYLTFFTMYQRLAQVANLQYYRLRGFRPEPTVITFPNGTKIVKDPWSSYNEADFIHDCEWPHHTSSVDAMLQRSCNGKTKITPIAIDEGSFRGVLDMALDDIECKDSICRFDEQRAAGPPGTTSSLGTGGVATFGGPNKGVIYKDMLTNETWSPVNGPWQSSVLSAAEAPNALQKSRSVQGRIWKPMLFNGESGGNSKKSN
jgi:Glycosyltransferase 61